MRASPTLRRRSRNRSRHVALKIRECTDLLRRDEPDAAQQAVAYALDLLARDLDAQSAKLDISAPERDRCPSN